MGVKMTTHFATPSPTTPNNFLLPLPDRALLYAPSPLPGSTTPPNCQNHLPNPEPPTASAHFLSYPCSLRDPSTPPDQTSATAARPPDPYHDPARCTRTSVHHPLLRRSRNRRTVGSSSLRPNKGFETGQGTVGPPLYPGFCRTGIGRECVIIFGLLQDVFQ